MPAKPPPMSARSFQKTTTRLPRRWSSADGASEFHAGVLVHEAPGEADLDGPRVAATEVLALDDEGGEEEVGPVLGVLEVGHPPVDDPPHDGAVAAVHHLFQSETDDLGVDAGESQDDQAEGDQGGAQAREHGGRCGQRGRERSDPSDLVQA